MSKAEVRLVGWGSSLLDEAGLSRQPVGRKRAWSDKGKTQVPSNPANDDAQQIRERVAQVMAHNDRRRNPRVAQFGDVNVQQVSLAFEEGEIMVSGDLQNVSRGGICIGSRVPLLTSSVVHCQIGVPDLQYGIPTLMQVMWLEKVAISLYNVGLRYLL